MPDLNWRERAKRRAPDYGQYVPRTLALRKLQVSLPEFRTLCILKGIFPRIPRRPQKGSDKIFYSTKDVRFILRDPALQVLRDQKTVAKKVNRFRVRKEIERAKVAQEALPDFDMALVLRQRYPNFRAALADIDDALCTIALFASAPAKSHDPDGVPTALVVQCRRVMDHWNLLVAELGLIDKAYATIKGYYYGASVCGQQVTWLAPHEFPTALREDQVDIDVMKTFLKLYLALVSFVLFKLYKTAGLLYPPPLAPGIKHSDCRFLDYRLAPIPLPEDLAANQGHDSHASAQAAAEAVEEAQAEADAAEADADAAEGDAAEAAPAQARPASLAAGSRPGRALTDAEEQLRRWEAIRRGVEVLGCGSEEAKSRRRVFGEQRFYVSRETPLWQVVLILKAGGARGVGFDESLRAAGHDEEEPVSRSPYGANDAGVTHHVVDRPAKAMGVLLAQLSHANDRIFVQPQWVFDCLNMAALLPTTPYAPGLVPPPHLSPFVQEDPANDHVPEQRRVLAQWAGKTRAADSTLRSVEHAQLLNEDHEAVAAVIERHQAALGAPGLTKPAAEARKAGKAANNQTPESPRTAASMEAEKEAPADEQMEQSSCEEGGHEEEEEVHKAPLNAVLSEIAQKRAQKQESLARERSKVSMTRKPRKKFLAVERQERERKAEAERLAAKALKHKTAKRTPSKKAAAV